MRPQRKSVRSDSYQHVFAELIVDPFNPFWAMNPDEKFTYSNEFLEANDHAAQVILKLLPTILSDKEMTIITCLLEGDTQWEVANKIDVDQSHIHQRLAGHCYYHKGVKKRGVKGGIYEKIRKALLTCVEFRLAIQELSAIFDRE